MAYLNPDFSLHRILPKLALWHSLALEKVPVSAKLTGGGGGLLFFTVSLEALAQHSFPEALSPFRHLPTLCIPLAGH